MSSHRDSGAVAPAGEELFRRVCGRFATGVTVVATTSPEGLPRGLTVNSFSSVSLDPPMVLVCIDSRNQLLPRLLDGTPFAINVLSTGQAELSRRFAGMVEDRFEGVAWSPGSQGAPILADALAWFECTLARAIECGDHTVLIAAVRTLQLSSGEPLLFYDGGYRRVASA